MNALCIGCNACYMFFYTCYFVNFLTCFTEKKQIRQTQIGSNYIWLIRLVWWIGIQSHVNQWKVTSKHRQLKLGSFLGNFHRIWISIVSQSPKNSQFVIENPIYYKVQRSSRGRGRLMQYQEESETQGTYPEIVGLESFKVRLGTSANCQAGSSSFRDAVEII